METTLCLHSSAIRLTPSQSGFLPSKISLFGSKNLQFSIVGSSSVSQRARSCSASDNNRRISSLESLFCYDKAIPEQIIEPPVGLSIAEKEIGDQPCCNECQAKGAVLCSTCCGSGLYIDSVMESQGIIVKVRCLGCGGSGNIMCSECGGRGHL